MYLSNVRKISNKKTHQTTTKEYVDLGGAGELDQSVVKLSILKFLKT